MSTQLTVSQLREELSDVITGIKDGSQTAGNANAIVNAIGKYISTVRLQLDYCQIIGKTPDIPLLQIEREKK